MSNREFDRRGLLRGLGTSAIAMSAASYSRVMGANETIQMGIIGAGERGRGDMRTFTSAGSNTFTAVCDIYAQNIDQAKQIAPNSRSFSDHRKLLELKDLDAVLVATPDHWHKTCAIDALNAGKDVYVEKPLTRTPEEGPEIVKAARINERVCQVGMQQRSGKHYIQAKQEFIEA